nr:hypothetical protein [Candidatus Sigynarchaeota archaeon]
MVDVIVHTYRINGYYKTRYGVNRCYFEKEIRGINVEDVKKTLKILIGARKVDPHRIIFEKIEEITNPEDIKDRVVRTFATEKIRF